MTDAWRFRENRVKRNLTRPKHILVGDFGAGTPTEYLLMSWSKNFRSRIVAPL